MGASGCRSGGRGWEFPPFSMTERQGWLIGRGVQDNKSAAVAILYVLKAMEELGLSRIVFLTRILAVQKKSDV